MKSRVKVNLTVMEKARLRLRLRLRLEATQKHNVEYDSTPKPAAGSPTRCTTGAACRKGFCSSCASPPGHLKTGSCPGCPSPTPHTCGRSRTSPPCLCSRAPRPRSRAASSPLHSERPRSRRRTSRTSGRRWPEPGGSGLRSDRGLNSQRRTKRTKRTRRTRRTRTQKTPTVFLLSISPKKYKNNSMN